MSISIAQSRQQLSAPIAAAQQQPQIITNRNTPVAVLVSAEYFARCEAAVKPVEDSFYALVQQLRETFPPQDEQRLPHHPRHCTARRRLAGAVPGPGHHTQRPRHADSCHSHRAPTGAGHPQCARLPGLRGAGREPLSFFMSQWLSGTDRFCQIVISQAQSVWVGTRCARVTDC